jgi:transketolase
MRTTLFKELIQSMREDESIFFLTAATGYNLVEPIFDEFPNRSLNVGIAEQNMIGIASGLVNTGFIPICYAITNFLVERPFEQIRNDICLHSYKIILAGTSTGYDQGALGATHHILDDIGALKALPNLGIYSPSGTKSMSIVFKEALNAKLASFIRIPKGSITETTEVISPNHFILENDSTVLVISHGKMVSNSISAFDVSPTFSLYAMDRIKPLDESILKDLFGRFEVFIVIEDNFSSGLYNSICQWLIENDVYKRKVISFSPKESYDDIMGDTDYLEEKHGLSPNHIAKRIKVVTDQYT